MLSDIILTLHNNTDFPLDYSNKSTDVELFVNFRRERGHLNHCFLCISSVVTEVGYKQNNCFISYCVSRQEMLMFSSPQDPFTFKLGNESDCINSWASK